MSYIADLRRNIFGDIRSNYVSNPVKPTQNVELEIRFGEYSIPVDRVPFFNQRTRRNETRPEIRREIQRSTYSRLLENFRRRGSSTFTDTTDCSMDDIRRSTDNVTLDVTWLRKTSLMRPFDNRDYRLRVAMSLESNIPPIDNFIPNITRSKRRHSFNFLGKFRIDLTEVTTITDDNSNTGRITYEIELEAITRDITERDINIGIHFILQNIQNSNLVYSEPEYFELINYFNPLLGRKLNERGLDRRFNNKVLYQPRNLHHNDLVYGGIVGNKNNEIYKVTWKTDGIRKLMVMSPLGIWLIWPPYEANLLIRWSNKSLVGTILEGEFVPRERRFLRRVEPGTNTVSRMSFREYASIKRSDANSPLIAGYEAEASQEYWFLVFDTLAVPTSNLFEDSGTSIQEKPHSVRMLSAQIFINNLVRIITDNGNENLNNFINKKFFPQTKDFKTFTNAPEFFSRMRDFDAKSRWITYEIDGYIFTPENMPYNSKNNTLPLHKRVLTDYADICKYKPPDQITIDFSIYWKEGLKTIPPADISCAQGSKNPLDNIDTDDRHIELRVFARDAKLVPFLGTRKVRFDQTKVDSDHPLTKNVPTDTVVEYQWDNERDLMVPLRIRYDKQSPNREDIAGDNWDLINLPINLDTLLGNTDYLLRNYHNIIKRDLFNNAFSRHTSSASHQQSGRQSNKPSLLDIGSGKGGDLSKWRNYGKIIAVEPNVEYIRDGLIPRITRVMGQDEIKIISSMEEARILMPEILQRGDRIVVINTGGENTELITMVTSSFLDGGKADVISMMLSLSFFWESSNTLDSLVNTIGQNLSSRGEFIFLTVNGDTVEEMFNPKFGNGPQISYLRMGPPESDAIEMKLDIPDRKVWINIPNSIVTDQTEWLVKLDDLQIRLERYGFSLKSLHRADKEGFLTPAELVFTQMYSYGSFTNIEENSMEGVINAISDPVFVTSPPSKPQQPLTLPPAQPPLTQPPLSQPLLSQPSPKVSPPKVSPPKVSPPTKMSGGFDPSFDDESLLILDEPVLSPSGGTNLPSTPGEDLSQIIPCKWYNQYPVVKISTIGDGSCFIHALLKAYLPSYANDPSYQNRIQFAKEIRRDLAYSLQMPDPNNPGKNYYESYEDGAFITLKREIDALEEEVRATGEIIEGSVDYSLQGLQCLFNSTQFLGAEMFKYSSEKLGINTVVTIPQTNDLVQADGGELENRKHHRTVFIGGTGCHYETIGVYIQGKGIQTVFDENDPFMIAYYVNRVYGEIRNSINNIIRKIQRYQGLLMDQVTGSNVGQVLSQDPIFNQLKALLVEAKQLNEESQDLQDIAIKGSDNTTLDKILDNSLNIDIISTNISSIVNPFLAD